MGVYSSYSKSGVFQPTGDPGIILPRVLLPL